ncbi:MmcQ/YjbR family DNA-binding protein [Yoonia sp. 208BN28-4]|uniref:MmcQ/YjbR family DNA-binding protein n=1 Tax=Yoonia sp. 208BN28-4 TaxID=3126505 RepID=UPI0030A063EA
MTRDTVNRLCADHAGATLDHKLGDGHDSWKVGGKLFAIVGAMGESVSVKTDSVETAQMLIDAGAAQKAAYLHKRWVAVPLDAAEDELRHRIHVSYDIIRASLSKKAQAALDQA